MEALRPAYPASTHLSTQHCRNTTTAANRRSHRPHHRHPAPTPFLPLQHDHTLLEFSTLFPPDLYAPALAERIQNVRGPFRGALVYSDALWEAARPLAASLRPYAALHFRAGDGEFKKGWHQEIVGQIRVLRSQALAFAQRSGGAPCTAAAAGSTGSADHLRTIRILVIGDSPAKMDRLQKSAEFLQPMRALAADLRALGWRLVMASPFCKDPAAQRTMGNMTARLQLGAAVVPHFADLVGDILLAALAVRCHCVSAAAGSRLGHCPSVVQRRCAV